MAPNYRNMTVGSAIQHAKALSGLTYEQISSRTGWTVPMLKKLFNEFTDRTPDLNEAATICNALGNSVLLDWMRAQIEVPNPDEKVQSCPDLLMRVNHLMGDFGSVSREVEEAIQDGVIDYREAAKISGKLLEVERHSRGLRDGLSHIKRHRSTSASVVFVEVHKETVR